MSLSSLHLDAFQQLARTLNFSRAAKDLHITQSALTQRIQNLEEDLALTLFIRNPRGVTLTAAGERLLRYCQARTTLEGELVADLKGEADAGLGGILRIAAFSTVLRSVVLPTLAPFLRENRQVTPFLFDAETRSLPDLLLRGAADFILLDRELPRQDVESHLLGHEEYVLASSREHDAADAPFLDHDPEDTTTFRFFQDQDAQPAGAAVRRGYLDEIYGIMDGVALGIGRAVIPRHLAARDERLRIAKGFHPLRTPVYLLYFKQPFYTELHKVTVAQLLKAAPRLLS